MIRFKVGTRKDEVVWVGSRSKHANGIHGFPGKGREEKRTPCYYTCIHMNSEGLDQFSDLGP